MITNNNDDYHYNNNHKNCRDLVTSLINFESWRSHLLQLFFFFFFHLSWVNSQHHTRPGKDTALFSFRCPFQRFPESKEWRGFSVCWGEGEGLWCDGGGAHITTRAKNELPICSYNLFPSHTAEYFHTILQRRPPESRGCTAVSLHHGLASPFQSFRRCPSSSHRDHQVQRLSQTTMTTVNRNANRFLSAASEPSIIYSLKWIVTSLKVGAWGSVERGRHLCIPSQWAIIKTEKMDAHCYCSQCQTAPLVQRAPTVVAKFRKKKKIRPIMLHWR